jgi:hypothetical protein
MFASWLHGGRGGRWTGCTDKGMEKYQMLRFARISPAAAAVIGGAILFTSGSAMAQDPLPNDRWQWVEVGSTEPTIESGLLYTRSGDSGNCQTRAAISTTPGETVYAAENPGGNIVDSKGTYTDGGGDPDIATSGGNLGTVSCASLGMAAGQTTLFVDNP